MPCRRRHPVIRDRHVGSHSLAIAIDKLPGVATALCLRRHPAPGGHGRRRLGDRRGDHPNRPAIGEPVAAREPVGIDLPHHGGARLERRVRGGIREDDLEPPRIDVVAACRNERRQAGSAQELVAGEAEDSGDPSGSVAGCQPSWCRRACFGAAESAARSAALCATPLPVAALPIAASKHREHRISPAPRVPGACPRSPPGVPLPESRDRDEAAGAQFRGQLRHPATCPRPGAGARHVASCPGARDARHRDPAAAPAPRPPAPPAIARPGERRAGTHRRRRGRPPSSGNPGADQGDE